MGRLTIKYVKLGTSLALQKKEDKEEGRKKRRKRGRNGEEGEEVITTTPAPRRRPI